MFSPFPPADETVRVLVSTQKKLPFSYPDPGATLLEKVPEGFRLLHRRVRLGSGAATFSRARYAIRSWRMFRMRWVRLYWLDVQPEVGAVVIVAARGAGLWTLNACRVVYTVDQPGPVETYGFAYGTLPEHIERGEERFLVQWDHSDDSVWYDLMSFSRPAHPLARVGGPLVRRFQRRFATASMATMEAACGKA